MIQAPQRYSADAIFRKADMFCSQVAGNDHQDAGVCQEFREINVAFQLGLIDNHDLTAQLLGKVGDGLFALPGSRFIISPMSQDIVPIARTEYSSACSKQAQWRD